MTYRPTHQQLARYRRASDRRHGAQRVAYCPDCAGAVAYVTPAPAPERCPDCARGYCPWPREGGR